MIKLFSLLFSAIVLLVAALAEGGTTDGVYVYQERSTGHEGESGIVITCSIETGNISGFARLQGNVPQGFKAEAMVTENAQFIASGEQFKFIWIELPASPLIQVKYRLIPTGEPTAGFSVTSAFSYILDGKTVTFHTDPLFIEPTAVLARQLQQQKPAVERKIITLDQDAEKYRVEIRIRNGVGQLPSRYVDELPENYTASLLEKGGAITTTDGRKVRFDWKTFPDQQDVEIVYVLNRNGSEEAPIIEGFFLFGDELEIAQQGEDYRPLTMESTEDEQFDRSGLMASLSPVLPEVSETVSTADRSAVTLSSSPIHYKLQVLATRESPALNPFQLKSYQRNNEPIELYEYAGWRKYMTGQYDSYEAARQAKLLMRDKVQDAFIVAFRNGEPISVSEALSAKNSAD